MISATRPRPARRRLRYGASPRQYVDLLTGVETAPCVLFIHGGFWRAEKDSESLWPAVEAVIPLSGSVGSVEYRTVETGGAWPACGDDVVTAVRHVWRALDVPPASTVLVGHSAGGQLALVAAHRLPDLGAVLALAPISDLDTARADDLGSGAVCALLGGRAPDADLLSAASPAHQQAPACRVELLHGDADQTVPVSHTLGLTEHWAGARVDTTIIADARHMHVVNPERPAWDIVLSRLVQVLDAVSLPSDRIRPRDGARQ